MMNTVVPVDGENGCLAIEFRTKRGVSVPTAFSIVIHRKIGDIKGNEQAAHCQVVSNVEQIMLIMILFNLAKKTIMFKLFREDQTTSDTNKPL